MPSDSDFMTYIFLALAALLFVMILVNVLAGPRKRKKRRPFEGGNASDTSGGGDPGPLVQSRGKRWDGDGDSDGGGGDGGGGGGE